MTDAIGADRADRLTTFARDNVVTLSDTVRSGADRDAALAAAALAPMVMDVRDDIRVVAD